MVVDQLGEVSGGIIDKEQRSVSISITNTDELLTEKKYSHVDNQTRQKDEHIADNHVNKQNFVLNSMILPAG